MKPLVYVAGPYSSPDPVENINRAAHIATQLREDNVITPVIPHFTGMWHLVDPAPYQVWLDYDLEVMNRCDAVYRFPGKSSGADGETDVALRDGIPVFFDIPTLYSWAEAVQLIEPTRYTYGTAAGGVPRPRGQSRFDRDKVTP